MKNDDLWILWRLSTQEKLERQRFECSLILEFTDHSKPQVINLDELSSNTHHNNGVDGLTDSNQGIYNQWLHIQRKTAPFSQLHDADVPNQNNLSLLLSCFIDVEALLRGQPKLAYIYLWAAAKYQKIYLETLYPLSQLRDIELREPNQVFVQMYPKIPSEKYVDMDYEFDDSKTLPELLARIWGSSEPEEQQERPKQKNIPELKEPQKPALTSEKPELNSHEIIGGDEAIDAQADSDNHVQIGSIHENPDIAEDVMATNNDGNPSIWGPFSSQDLADLIQGFNDWQRAYGRHELADHLPATLLTKLDGEYQVAYWTSGQGVSNMILDNNPPRHTMVLGFIEKQSQHGIGYCIQKPSSLDNIWAHKQWHTLHCTEGKIAKVTPLFYD